MEVLDYRVSGRRVISNFISRRVIQPTDLISSRIENRRGLFLTLNSQVPQLIVLGELTLSSNSMYCYHLQRQGDPLSDDLVGWWSFDEANGSLVADQSGGDAFAKLIGGASIDTVGTKFGTGALRLNGSNSWAEVGSLMEPSKITRENDLIGWWKFDEISGTNAKNSATGLSDASLVDNATFSTIEKKFGDSSLHLPTSSSNARVTLSPALDLGGTSTVATFTMSTWFRNLYPTGSWRTLTRGSTNGHHLIVSDVTNRVGVFANGNGDWRDSGEFDLEADGLWHQIVLVSDG